MIRSGHRLPWDSPKVPSLLPLSSSPRPTPSLSCVGSGCGLPSFPGGHGGGVFQPPSNPKPQLRWIRMRPPFFPRGPWRRWIRMRPPFFPRGPWRRWIRMRPPFFPRGPWRRWIRMRPPFFPRGPWRRWIRTRPPFFPRGPWRRWIRTRPPFFPRGPWRRCSRSPPSVSMDEFSSSRNHPRGGDQLGPLSSQLAPVDLPFRREIPFCRGLCPPRTLGDAHSPFGCLLSHPHPPSQQTWLRFVWRRRVSHFRALPFALGPAPGIFN